MSRYLVSLIVSVVFMALVFVAWTPAAKAGNDTSQCEEYCKSVTLCACVGKLTGNVRLTKCEFPNDICVCPSAGGNECYVPGICDCGTPNVKGCLRLKENEVAWDSVILPQPLENTCTPEM
jgi:hypothetical protein